RYVPAPKDRDNSLGNVAHAKVFVTGREIGLAQQLRIMRGAPENLSSIVDIKHVACLIAAAENFDLFVLPREMNEIVDEPKFGIALAVWPVEIREAQDHGLQVMHRVVDPVILFGDTFVR